MLEFRQVSLEIRRQPVLEQVSFTAREGEMVVLIGPSGCGKSSCLRMVNRLEEPTAGQVLLDGQDIRREDPVSLRRRIGYVTQRPGLFPHLTVEENLFLLPCLEGLPPGERQNRAARLVEEAGLPPEETLFRYPSQLAPVQRQRVAVARALAGDPELLLMDDPFAALDPITRSQLQDRMISFHARSRRTVLFVTHDMDEAIKIAGRICIMDRGRVLQYDTPENILKYPADDFVREFVGRGRIWSSPQLIRAQDIMLTTPVTAPGDMAFLRAVEVMRMSKVDSLMVVDGRHRLLGVVSVKALGRRAQEGAPAQETATLAQLMDPSPPTCRPEESIVSLLQRVNREELSTLPVVDDRGVLRGLITKGSLVSTLSRRFLIQEGGTAQ